MDPNVLDQITQILNQFVSAKSSSQALEVQGPAQEGSNYRWRMTSNRNREVTIVVSTKKPMFGKSTMTGIEVYGFGDTKALKPNVKDLEDFLMQSELVLAR